MSPADSSQAGQITRHIRRGSNGGGESVPFLQIQILAALSLAFLLSVGFFGLDYRSLALFNFDASMWVPAAPFEDSIPFFPAWIWVYIAYYPLCFAPLAIREIQTDRETFWRVVGAYLFQFGVGFAVFWLIPSRMIRPEPAGGYWTSFALTLTYRLDPGFNIFPSMHVCNLVYAAWLFRRFSGKAWGLAMGSAALLVSLSTLFVKQHCVADVAAGAVLGTLTFFLFHPPSKRPARV